MPTRHLLAATVAAAAMLIAIPGRGASPRETSAVPKPDPKVRITTDRNTGFSPLEITVTGKVSGIESLQGNFCHPRVIWTVWDVERELFLQSASDPRCRHDPDHSLAPAFFRKTFRLGTGTHLCRLSIQGKNGRLISSNYVRVEVH